MNSFHDTFGGSELSNQWRPHPDAKVSYGKLRFGPSGGAAAELITRSDQFSDFSMSADVRIVRGAVGFVLRWQSSSEYYLVQFDLGPPGDDADKAWFHRFSSADDYGIYRELIPSQRVPELGVWCRMNVKVEGYRLTLSLGDIGQPLVPCAEWTDRNQAFRSGCVGFWEHEGDDPAGERGEYRNLEIESIRESPAGSRA